MNNDREKIIDKVRKLLAFTTENASESEVANAAARVQELLMKYNIDLAEVRKADEKPEYIWHQQSVAGTIWKRALLLSITEYNLCKGIISGDNKHVHVVGQKHNVEVALFLYVYLRREIERLANEELPDSYRTYYAPKHRTRWINSFCSGAALTIRDRLKAAHEAVSNTGRALIVVNEQALSEEVKTRFGNTTSFSSPKRSTYHSALSAGRQAGQNIPINLGLRGSGNKTQIGGR